MRHPAPPLSTRLCARSDGPGATAQLAASLAPRLRPGDVLLLRGALGAGKTAFVAGLVQALGGEGPVQSPTFTLENRYPLPGPAGELVHVDLYRPGPEGADELLPGLLEQLDEGRLLCVEWPEPLESRLGPALRLRIGLVEGQPTAREFALEALAGRELPPAGGGWS